MTLTDYLAALRRGWRILLVAFLVAMACGTALVVARAQAATTYTTTARLYVETVEPASGADAARTPGSDFTMNRAASYAGVLGGNVVAAQVADDLGSSGDETVTVTAPVGTVIIDIVVTSGDPDRALDVAQAYVDLAPSVVEGLDQTAGGEPRVELTTVNEPGKPTASPAPSWLPILVAAGVLGLGLGFTIVMVREVLRRERTQARPSERTGRAA